MCVLWIAYEKQWNRLNLWRTYFKINVNISVIDVQGDIILKPLLIKRVGKNEYRFTIRKNQFLGFSPIEFLLLYKWFLTLQHPYYKRIDNSRGKTRNNTLLTTTDKCTHTNWTCLQIYQRSLCYLVGKKP